MPKEVALLEGGADDLKDAKVESQMMSGYGRVRQSQKSRVGALSLALSMLAICGCSVQQSRLLTRRASDAGVGQGGASNDGGSDPRLNVSGAGPVTLAVVAAIDERPIGGASLSGGTIGGGTYAEALGNGQIHYVDTEDGIRDLIGSQTPAILLIAEKAYNFGTTPQNLSVCTQLCTPATPIAQQTSSACPNGEAKSEIQHNFEFLRFASNKTLIGLGNGATFNNAMISFSSVTNIILRNLTIQNVDGTINGEGYGINLWPGDHVWVDHCSFRNIGHAYFHIAPNINDTTLAIEDPATGYITITNNYFDGKVDGICGQRSPFVLDASRSPAVTIARNWFNRSNNRNPFIFGPETWTHLFNNYWSDIDYSTVGVACGASAILQGNAFESAVSALSISNNGEGTLSYCTAKPYGIAYAPTNTGSDEDNLFDSASTLTLHSQPTDGTGLTKPVRVSGHRFTLTTPTESGTSTETYEVTLNADPTTVAAQVKATAGAGTLF